MIGSDEPHSPTAKNIEPGTRVRSTEDRYPNFANGTFKRRSGRYYMIEWDSYPPVFGYFLHLENEFEVIE